MKARASQRGIGPFRSSAVRAMLCACPDRAPFIPKTVIGAPRSASCPTIFSFRMNPGRASAARSNTTLSPGTSSTIGPRAVPVTDAEIDVFEAWFGDLFYELFGPSR
jgi:hypothetical protein